MTKTVPTIRLLIGDDTYVLDMTKFMLSEAMALEEDWGLKVAEFKQLVVGGDPPMRVVAAMVWLAQTRALAETEGVTFPEAHRLNPPSKFDVDLVALKVEPDSPATANPTERGTPTRTTRTTRATSASKRSRTS